MTQETKQPQLAFNPLAYGELPQQKAVSPAEAVEIFAKRKAPKGVQKIKKAKNSLLADYPNGGTSIPEQARALRNNVDLIYQFVHDNVEFLPNYGLHKGGLGALVDGSGNAFDQSDLMVRLLTEAGYTANYVIGYIKLSAAQWSNWLGVNSANISEAVQLLANGGISAAGNSTTNEITLGHCWVKVSIDSVDYAFDPAFKTYNYTSSIVDLATAMNYDRATFLSRAESGSTTNSDYAKDLHDANINADLTTFSMNLVNWIKDNNSGATFDQILSGKRIQPAVGTLRQTDLPYHDTSLSTITSNVMPNNKKATFRFQYDFDSSTSTYRVDVAFYTADLYGKRPTLWFDGSRVARFFLDGTQYGSASSAQGAGTETNAVFSVVHPYVSTFADTVQTTSIKAGAQTTIGAAFGWASKHLAAAHQELQNNLIAAGAATSSEPMLGTSLLLIWDNYIGQASSGADLVCRISNTNQILHHLVGTVSQLPTGSGSLKVISSFLAAFSTSALTAGGDITATAFTNSLFFQSLEGAVNRQVTGIEAADIASVIRKVNQLGIKVYDAKSSNWTTGANVSSLMATAGYPAAEITKIGTTFITPGWRVAMPETAAVPIGSFSNFYAYMGIAPNNRSLLSQTWFGAKGAVAAGYQTDADTNSAASDNARQVNGFGMPAATSTESARVNLLNGRYEYSSQDLTVGNQGAPYELSFVRSYNSALRLTFQGMGFGWSHNWLMKAFENSDGFISLGEQQVSAAAPAIAALFITRDVALSNSAIPIKNLVIASIIQSFLSAQMAANVVRVQDGAGVQVFTKMPDGSYLPGIGMHGACTLIKSGSPAFFTFTTADKVVYTYRSSGEVSTISYPFGITVSFTYNATTGRLTKVSNGFRDINFTYDTFNQLKTINDGNGRTVTFTLNSATGNLTSVQDPLSQTTTYAYDQRGRMTQVFKPAFPSSPVVTNSYDTLNRVKEQTDAYGNLWQFFVAGSRSEEVAPDATSRVLFFNGKGNTVKSINALGDIVATDFDGAERPVKVVLPEGNSSTTIYDWQGNVVTTTQHGKPGSGLSDRATSFTYDSNWPSKVKTVTDAAGRLTTNSYAPPATNGAGHLTSVQLPTVAAGTPLSQLTYNSIGQLLTFTDPTGLVTSRTYNPTDRNLMSAAVDPSGLNIITSFTYDPVGNIVTVTDAKGFTKTTTYDSNRRATQTTGPAPNTDAQFVTFDANGNVTQSQALLASDPNSQITTITYTIDGKIASVIGPPNYGEGAQPSPLRYEYDNLRRPASSTNSDGITGSTIYDALSRPSSTSLNGIVQQSFTYTPNGNLATITDARGKTTVFEYDGFDRSSKVNYPDGKFEQVAYDISDNILSVVTRGGGTIAFTFDELNRTMTKTPQGQSTITFSYDLANRPLVTSRPVIAGDPSTGAFSVVYDSAGRAIEEHYPDGKVVTGQLDTTNNVQKLIYSDGSFVTYTLDTLDRLSKVAGFTGEVSFEYDTASRLISKIHSNKTGQGFVYDKHDNLLSTAIGGLQPSGLTPKGDKLTFNYTKDNFSYDTSRASNDPSFVWTPTAAAATIYGAANDINQYPTVDTANLVYDGNGCLTFDGTNTYGYDVEGKLISCTGPGGSVSYKYDPYGRLIERTVGSAKTRYVYAGVQRLEEYDSTGSLTGRYIYGQSADDCLFTVDAGNNVTYLHSSADHSTILATDSNGVAIQKCVFSPWGQLSSGSLSGVKIGFTGQIFEPETGLYYYKNRHYHPKLGRFLQLDPIGYEGGMNLYEYCGSDPINHVDPLGFEQIKLGIEHNVYIEPEVPRYPNLPPYLTNNYLRGSYASRPGGLYGSGGGGAWNNFLLQYYTLMLMFLSRLAAPAAAPPVASPPPPPPPPKYLKQGVDLMIAIFKPGIDNIIKDPLMLAAAIPGGFVASRGLLLLRATGISSKAVVAGNTSLRALARVLSRGVSHGVYEFVEVKELANGMKIASWYHGKSINVTARIYRHLLKGKLSLDEISTFAVAHVRGGAAELKAAEQWLVQSRLGDRLNPNNWRHFLLTSNKINP